MSDNNRILCISDLHLSPERPDVFKAFSDFLVNKAETASTLFILGDFFNVWIGDDEPGEFYDNVCEALKTLCDKGTQVFIMHGNRDFLLGKAFCESCHARLIAEPYLLECFGAQYLLMHGDSLCTKDRDYMAFRSLVRDPAWQKEFLSKTLEERQAFARQARAQSKSMNSNKAEDIMDVTPEEVARVMNDTQQHILIHGHTHRPAVHDIDLQGVPGKRIVLGDWDKKGWFVEITPEGSSLESFTL